MNSLLMVVGLALFVAFGAIVFRGAPYVPTHKKRALRALDMLDLPAGSTIVDLGSGDGVVLKLAARRGLRAVGYELNPFLCLVSYVRCWRYRHLVQVRWRDFWLSPIPPATDAVFVFLAGPYMRKLGKKLTTLAAKHSKQLRLVSYGFAVPGLTVAQQDGDIYIYALGTGDTTTKA